MNKHFLEKMQVVGGVTPVNLAAGTTVGDFVSMKNYGRCAIVLYKGIGGASEDTTITIDQAVDVAGSGTVKVVEFTRADYKAGTLLTAVGTFTTVEQAAAGTYLLSGIGTYEGIVVIDIKAEDLDIDGGFDCIRAKMSDPGTTAQLGGLLYFLHEPRNAKPTMDSAIVD